MAVSAQKKRLGRSLASLIGDEAGEGATSEDQRAVPLSALKASSYNPVSYTHLRAHETTCCI